MTTVTTVVHPGWLEVAAGTVHALVEAGDRHAAALTEAAGDGLPALLDALARHGLTAMPSFAAVDAREDGVRVVVRGRAAARLADGTAVGDGAREPWSDTDVPLEATGGEVVLLAPHPGPPRGWRRPALLDRAAAGAPAEPEPGVEEAAEPEPEVEEPAEPEPEEELQPESEPVPPQPDLTLPPPEEAAGPPAARVPAASTPPTAIIDSVPWRRAGEPSAAVPVPAADAPAAPAQAEEPPAPDPDPAPAPPAPPAEQTASAPEVDEEPAGAAPEVTTARGSLTPEADLDRPVVLAVLCPAGHHSPPHAGHCRSCGREIPPQQPFQTPRPPLGVLRISTGGVVPLDRGVLLGRAPRVNEELPANQRPHLIRVGSADRDISRNHAEVLLEGWHVLVRDLGSTNGTTVALPGEDAVRLRPTEDRGIEPGAVITLADEVSLTYEVEE